MTLKIKRPDSRGSSRYFTIASSPLDPYITVTTRVIKSSFKKGLLALKKGDTVDFFGPMGNFVIDDSDHRTKVFLAGGIGITTFYSMIKYYGRVKPKFKTVLIASFSNSDDAIYFQELSKIAQENSDIEIIFTISSVNKANWEVGRIDGEKIAKYAPDLMGNVYYLVGPQSMVEVLTSVLEKLEIPKENIIKEDFTGY